MDELAAALPTADARVVIVVADVGGAPVLPPPP